MLHPVIAKLESIGPLPEDDRRLLNRLLEDVRSFRPGQTMIRQGDKPTHIRVVLEGWAFRYQIARNGKRQIIALLMPGDICGAHTKLVRAMDHSIGTLSEAKVAFVAPDLIEELAARPAIADALWWANLVDVAICQAWLISMGTRDAYSRLAHLFCEVQMRASQVGLATRDGLQMPLTQQDLGDITGMTAVHVNRMLKQLREDKLVTFLYESLTIKNLAGLRQAASFDPTYLHFEECRNDAAGVPQQPVNGAGASNGKAL